VTESPFFAVAEPEGDVTALAVVLHGGRSRSTAKVRANQLAVLRMVPFAKALHRAGHGHGLGVAHVRYRLRGWNGAAKEPVADVRWVLDRLVERFPGVPAALIGHSMGGRAAVYSADHPAVTTVVGLAPWIEAGDPVATLRGRRVLILHGDADRRTSAAAAEQYASAAAAVAQSASFVRVRGDGHAMLRRPRVWHRLTAGFAIAVLYGSAAAPVPALAEALAGEAALVV
jgi:pimeloyl-ACP methyl ester carboxylesterase